MAQVSSARRSSKNRRASWFAPLCGPDCAEDIVIDRKRPRLLARRTGQPCFEMHRSKFAQRGSRQIAGVAVLFEERGTLRSRAAQSAVNAGPSALVDTTRPKR